jgi:hypothetical protein
MVYFNSGFAVGLQHADCDCAEHGTWRDTKDGVVIKWGVDNCDIDDFGEFDDGADVLVREFVVLGVEEDENEEVGETAGGRGEDQSGDWDDGKGVMYIFALIYKINL